jgi:Tol biopolymer transport system component
VLVVLLLLMLAAPAYAATNQIAFTALVSSVGHLYVMNGDGTNVRQLTNAAVTDSAPTWSPDGSKLAFIRNGNTVMRINVDGTGLIQVSPSGDITATQGDIDADWSRDGRNLIFTHMICSGSPCTPLWSAIETMDAGGAGVNSVIVADGTHIYAQGHYSPDSTRIVLGSNTVGPEEIFVCNASSCGASLNQLTNYSSAGSPWWSPDGTKIVMEMGDTTLTGGNIEIATMSSVTGALNGAGLTLLTHGTEPSFDPGEPSYSADGVYIIFSVDNCTGSSLGTGCYGQGDNTVPATIWLMNADGTNQTNTGQACAAGGGSPRLDPVNTNVTASMLVPGAFVTFNGLGFMYH